MKHFKNILIQNKVLILVVLISGIFASLLEALGLGLVLPLLEGIKGEVLSNLSFPFDRLSAFFSGMSIVDRIRFVALFLVIVTVLKGIAIYLNTVYVSSLQIAAMRYYRMKCFHQLIAAGMSYINKQRISHLQTIAVTHTQTVGALFNTVGGLVPKAFTIFMLTAMLFLLSWKMTLLSLCIVIVSSFLLRTIAHKAEKAGKRLTESLKEINRAMLDILFGMKVIRLFRREKDMGKYFGSEVDRVGSDMLALVKARRSMQPLLEILGVVSLAAIMLAGSFIILSADGQMRLEVILTFILIFFRILSPAMAFNQARVAIRGDLPCYRQVHQFLDEQDKMHMQNGKKIFKSLEHSICYRDVDFGYNPKEAVVLHRVSFTISKGTKIGIVGPSGCGKSTIVELLLRFYDPQQGSIIVDGIDLRDFDLPSWRKCIGVVSQDTFLFNDTIGSNIAFANPDATQKDIEQAATNAYIHEFIKQLPKGYDTLVGERGVLLSGGQKQRIAIARAIVMNPDILIFDEATSSLDTESEEIVQRALDEVGKGKTVITIAHRLSTVYDSDMILVIDRGKIIQQGIHKELVQKEDLYRKLVQAQSMDA